jgi:menaquinone reductase, multiheme cytochrome c subunit
MSSNADPKPSDVAGGASPASPAHPPAETPSGGGAYMFLFFIIGLSLSMVVGWAVFPKALYSTKNQPFDFNHKMHLEEVDNGCQSCHFFRADGTFSGAPRLDQCTGCHDEVLGESEDEAIFVKQYVEKNREVPWLVYARQPDCVFFSHAAHIYGAQLACETCHGPTGSSESLKPYQENRLTGYSRDIWGDNIAGIKHNTWDRMKMDDCAECHATAGIHDSSVQTKRDACFVCHK